MKELDEIEDWSDLEEIEREEMELEDGSTVEVERDLLSIQNKEELYRILGFELEI